MGTGVASNLLLMLSSPPIYWNMHVILDIYAQTTSQPKTIQSKQWIHRFLFPDKRSRYVMPQNFDRSLLEREMNELGDNFLQ